jgi:1-phosphatidylinositol-4-phosphate 5-kinase
MSVMMNHFAGEIVTLCILCGCSYGVWATAPIQKLVHFIPDCIPDYIPATGAEANGTPINNTFDIKGSWVNRNAQQLRPGKKAICRHCGETFIIKKLHRPRQFSSGSGGRVGGARAGRGSGADTIHSERCPLLAGGGHEAKVTLLDNDLLTKIHLQQEPTFELIEQLRGDSDFLCSLGIMDYSLIVGVHNTETLLASGPTPEQQSLIVSQEIQLALAAMEQQQGSGKDAHRLVDEPRSGSLLRGRESRNLVCAADTGFAARSVEGPGHYYFGVIDMLQTWTVQKRAERLLKGYVLCQPLDGISALGPTGYAERFQQKVGEIIDHQGFVRHRLPNGTLL